MGFDDFDDFGGMPADEFFLNESLYLEEEEKERRKEEDEEAEEMEDIEEENERSKDE